MNECQGHGYDVRSIAVVHNEYFIISLL